jgi:hypothetical protein
MLAFMKAYLVITGTIFALMAILHVFKAVADWNQLSNHPGDFLIMGGLGVFAAVLSTWAWRLLRLQRRA